VVVVPERQEPQGALVDKPQLP
jgi:hypothetical protein